MTGFTSDRTAQARAFGTRFVQGWVEQIVGVRDPPFEVRLEGGRVLRANALIVATGANTRWLGMESEKKYQSNGAPHPPPANSPARQGVATTAPPRVPEFSLAAVAITRLHHENTWQRGGAAD